MKFHEAIKYVTENPGEKVESFDSDGWKAELRQIDGYFYFSRFDENGNSIYSTVLQGRFNGNVHFDSDWHPVRQYVPFMEALNAGQREDKEICCEMDGEKWIYRHLPLNSVISVKEILNGKWYIIDRHNKNEKGGKEE